MKTKLFVLLIMAVFASKECEKAENDTKSGEKIENTDLIFVKIEEDEYSKKKTSSDYIGVTYYKRDSKWRAERWSKKEKKDVYNGYYDNEETAALASDTLARKLIDNGERGHKINFPNDETEVHPEEKKVTSDYIGVYYDEKKSEWQSHRWSKNEKKRFTNGCYTNEKKAAHASDTLARKLMENGEQGHKLNFPEDEIEVHSKKRTYTSEYFGVNYYKRDSIWRVERWSKNEKKTVHNGYYDNEETAALASDNLARKLMDNGEQRHKLNFPDSEEHSKEHQKMKRKRQNNFQDN